MFRDWVLLVISLGYLGLLFAIAYYGDRRVGRWRGGRREPVIYALSLAIYCTAWTFYGSVGRAVTNGSDFLLVYLGPILMLTAGYPLMRKIARVAAQQNVTSIADFIGARYGKSRTVAALTAVIVIVGVLPYLALQLQAVSQSFETMVAAGGGGAAAATVGGDTAFYVAMMMAVFAILFGVRHVQASERHEGMILAIAFESLVKLAAFLAVGVFVTYVVFDGYGDLFGRALEYDAVRRALDASHPRPSWILITLASACAILCLPRQFYVAFVAPGNPSNLRTATWLFPVYLVAINLFVPAIAAAGLVLLDGKAVPDQFVLSLPLIFEHRLLSLFVFIGGLSAATSMVIVEAVALSTMVSNELIVPLLLRTMTRTGTPQGSLGHQLLFIRRVSIFVILFFAYVYHGVIGRRYPLVSIGMISFMAVAQFAPALVIGLYWKRAHRYGAMAGMLVGASLWAYAVLLPTFVPGVPLPLPDLFFMGLEPPLRGLAWSLLANTAALVAVSLWAQTREHDQRQAEAFVSAALPEGGARRPAGEPPTAAQELRLLAARFLGEAEAERAFRDARSMSEAELAQMAEHLLSGAIGAASARIVVAAALGHPGTRQRAARAVLTQASEAILFSHELLGATMESVNVGIGVFDAERRLAAWNRRFAALLGLRAEVLGVGTPFTRLAAAAGGAGTGGLDLLSIAGAGRETGASHAALERRRPDGTILDIQVNPMPAGGFVMVLADVTERMRSAELLRDSEHRMRVYTDNVPVLMAYVDRNERYRFTNRAYEEAIGLSREQTDRLTIEEALGNERYRRLKPHIDGALKGNHVSFDMEFATRGGGFRLAHGTYIPHVAPGGEVVGLFKFYQDITEQRQAERVLREAKETLERHVAERTHDLTVLNQQLQRAKAAADAANLGKTKFIAAASHDLLQPLNAARLFASSLTNTPLDARQTALAGQVDQALGAVEDLLRALLDISRLDAGGLKPDMRSIPADEVLTGLVQSMAPLARRRGLALRHVPCALSLGSDPTLLRRVVQNLLANAIQYTRKGKVLIGCRRRNGRVSIEVWDTGVGIAEGDLALVFEEFRRLGGTDGDEPPGLGLGLAIVDRISRILGHPVSVRSWPGRGSVFAVSVPVGAEAPAPAAVPAAPVPALDALEGRRVLCVDNDRPILAGMRALLEGWGCEVALAAGLDEARREVREGGPPDIVLIDHHLGGAVTGLDVIDILGRELDRRLPVILISADRGETLAARARARGIALLNKPLRPAALRALMCQRLSAGAQAAE